MNNVNSFDILNNIISTKKITNDLLDQQILENEDSFEMFESNCSKNNYEINPNVFNLEIVKNNNNDKYQNRKEENRIIKEETNKENEIIIENKNEEIVEDNNKKNEENKKIENNENILNGLNNEKQGYQNKSPKSKRWQKSVKNNNFNDGFNKIKKMIEQINNGSINIKNPKNNINEIVINNRIKNSKKNASSNSVDYIHVEKKIKNKENNLNSKYKLEYRNNKNKIAKIQNKSIDSIKSNNYLYKENKLSFSNRFNIYQKLFQIKMENLDLLRLNSKNENFKFYLNNIMMTSPKKMAISPDKKSIFSDDEIIQRKREKNKTIENNSINIYANSNKISNYYIEDDFASFKSKKSKVQRQNSLSTFSNNSSEKFLQTYERFKEMEQRHKERLEFLKKVKEEKDKKICYFNPKINQKSRNIKDDFNTRQQKNLEQQKKKYEKIKNKLKKKIEEKKLLEKTNEGNKKRKLINWSTKSRKLNYYGNNVKKKMSLGQTSIDDFGKKIYTNKQKMKDKKQNLSMMNLQKYTIKEKNINIKNIKEKTLDSLKKEEIIGKERINNINKINSPAVNKKIIKNFFKDKNKDEDLFFDKKMKNKNNNNKNNEIDKINDYNYRKNNNKYNNLLFFNNKFEKKIRLNFKKFKNSRNKSSTYFIKSNKKNNSGNNFDKNRIKFSKIKIENLKKNESNSIHKKSN